MGSRRRLTGSGGNASAGAKQAVTAEPARSQTARQPTQGAGCERAATPGTGYPPIILPALLFLYTACLLLASAALLC
jgi:hypothetical protein